MSAEHLMADNGRPFQLTTFRVRTTVLGMGSLRPSIDSREVVPGIYQPASRWLPRVFKNLGRGVF